MPEAAPEPEKILPQKILVKNEEGEVTEEATMLNGVLEGETILYSYGRVVARLQFKNGKQDGESEFYDDSGQTTVKSLYRAGKLHGESIYFDHSAKIVRKASYWRGELHGRKTDFYQSGKAREVSHYLKGLLNGEFLRFTPDGKLEKRICYRVGKKVQCPPHSAVKRIKS